ncbi:MAG: FAD-dependent oxidoreductase [Burkholderiales bacterium]|nr:FAD-dependent oxidoreductase [Burkholderiales bacterium]MDE1928242.1 FAD-dependent oxidoreductase [Burkholderiales bacterium]MDE2158334.1 FAD-dependent oxidoreductase [Burkholderiales bacterium]MDE2505335.1 FAD-dependent oxidoreductase [Burkholderiales bacterium]
MTALDARIAIVGGGLAGLVAAWRLVQQGVRDVVLLEARTTLGGRILSVDAAGSDVDTAESALDRFDLGPSWFWPALQPQLDQLVAELGLQRFRQFEEGDLLVERSTQTPPLRTQAYASEPPSMRLAGGTGALVAALRARLDPAIVRTGQTVRRLRREAARVELTVEDAAGRPTVWRVKQVLLALPPRLAATGLQFEPSLPAELARRWRATPTWMAPHAKYVAVYDTPFWREQALCGSARSSVGPMGEIHDVSMPGGHAALFGFLGVPARVRRQVSDEVLRAHCRAQLARLFGERAGTPAGEALKDWAADPLTATADDQDAAGHQAAAPSRGADEGAWQGRLVGIGSEWSPQFPGYLAGAVDAAERGLREALVDIALPTPEPAA